MQWKVVAETKAVDLMATLLGKRQLAEEALKYLSICRKIPDPEEVATALDVSLAVAKKIVAAAVLSTKFVFGTLRLPLSDPERVAWLVSDLKAEPVENLVVLTVNAENTFLERHLVATGSATCVCVDYGDVYRYAIEDHATGIIVVYNHTGGHLRFTKDDFEFAKGLAAAGRLLNILFHDCVIISRRGFISMRREFPEIFELSAKMDVMAKLAR